MSTGMSMSDFVDYRATLTFTLFIFLTFTQLKTIFTYYSHLARGQQTLASGPNLSQCLVLSHFQMAQQILKGYYFTMWKLYAIQIAVSITKVLLPIHLCINYGCFCAQKAELISCNKDPTACNWSFTKRACWSLVWMVLDWKHAEMMRVTSTTSSCWGSQTPILRYKRAACEQALCAALVISRALWKATFKQNYAPSTRELSVHLFYGKKHGLSDERSEFREVFKNAVLQVRSKSNPLALLVGM